MDDEILRDLCVLYVEDDDEVREQLVLLLGLWFDRVLTAENGAVGLETFRREAPDLIVSDIQMPLMNGLQMVEEIRKESRLPVILTTAFNEQEHFLDAIRLGISQYVIKPVIADVLHNALIECAKSLRKDREIARYTAELREFNENAREELEITHHLMAQMMLTEKFHDDDLRYWVMPTAQFSGDMVAAKRLRDGDLYVFLADATGHGLPAAVNLLPLCRIFYAMSEKGFSVSAMVREMNKTLHEQSTPDRFVAATLIRINQLNRTLEVWNGGNPTGYFVSTAGEALFSFATQHYALGILPDQKFCSTSAIYQWQTAGQIWIYSDGVSDAMDENDALFGEERVLEVLTGLPAESRFTGLVDALQLHLGEQSAHDDISLVVVACP